MLEVLIFSAASWLNGLVVRLSKEDVHGPDVPAPWRPVLSLVLGVLVMGCDYFAVSGSLGHAAGFGLGSSLAANVGHWLGIEAWRGGREVAMPRFLTRPSDTAAPPKPKHRTFTSIVFGLVMLLASGCSGSLQNNGKLRVGLPEPAPGRCAALDDRHAFAGGVAKGGAVLAGGSGLGTIPAHDERLRIGLAIGSAAMAAVAAGAQFVSDDAASSWAKECSGQ